MFGGHDTTAKSVSLFGSLDSRSTLPVPIADYRPLGAREESSCPGKTSSGDRGKTERSQGQG